MQQRTAPPTLCPWPSKFWFKPRKYKRGFYLLVFCQLHRQYKMSPTSMLLLFTKQFFRIKLCVKLGKPMRHHCCPWGVCCAALRKLLNSLHSNIWAYSVPSGCLSCNITLDLWFLRTVVIFSLRGFWGFVLRVSDYAVSVKFLKLNAYMKDYVAF